MGHVIGQAGSDCKLDRISGRVAVAVWDRANIVARSILKILVIPLSLVGLVRVATTLAGTAIVPLSLPLVLLQYHTKAFPLVL